MRWSEGEDFALMGKTESHVDGAPDVRILKVVGIVHQDDAFGHIAWQCGQVVERGVDASDAGACETDVVKDGRDAFIKEFLQSRPRECAV